MATEPKAAARPLSPFMLGQYYRFQLTSVLSFLHRLTGLALALGSVFLAAWLLSAAAGPQAYARFETCARGPLGLVLLLGWSWALMYHLCNGIRHLVWDAGWAFELKNVYRGGWIVVGVSLLLTAAVWTVAAL
ncbi:MAG: succinate dehydrogenase, cytochrome b556 subunit [Sinobacteraceae bacterium]|jgi:succinate dehydrogenase / fumarate reductase cytochrome b subunit|nr:succinate dehydrogenase, cytochrome b556 subunit [Nevskia sp.]MDI3258293.1 succinate dehydrogenase, cytochrome b556 subunit [Nevskiaceae bacterium]